MASDLLQFVIRLTLASSVGILAVLMARRLVRAWFGPALAYRLWLIVPIAGLASLLPLTPRDIVLPAFALPFGDRSAFADMPGAVRIAGTSVDWSPVFFASVWLLGAIAFAVAILCEHRRALRAYGALTPAFLTDSLVHRTSRAGPGPSLIGVFRPQLIVPADFEARFTPQEQMLVLEHERQHSRAGDPLVNGVVAVLRCLNWFNPFVHLAAMMLRIDQELACDAAVIARRPGDRRAYAEALLKTQLGPVPTQLGCHWPVRSARLLVERVEMLGREGPRGMRRIAGVTLVLAIGFGAGLAAWAAQPARSNSLLINATAAIPPIDETRRLAAFAASDWDGDSVIDKAGYAQVLKMLGYAGQLESLFAQRDANQDGFVSAEEYRTPLPAPASTVSYKGDDFQVTYAIPRPPDAGADSPP